MFGTFSFLNRLTTAVPTAIRQSNIRQAAAAVVVRITLLARLTVESQAQPIPLVLDVQIVGDPNNIPQVGVTIHSDGRLKHRNVAIATLESAALGCNGYCVLWLYPVKNGVSVIVDSEGMSGNNELRQSLILY